MIDLAARIAEKLPELQRQAESMMVDACVIERAPEEPWVTDPETGRDVPAPWTEVYAGRCKVQSQQPYEITPDVGGATETVQRYMVHVPVGVGPVRIGDRIVARGRTFRVAGEHDKTFQTAQRLIVDELH